MTYVTEVRFLLETVVWLAQFGTFQLERRGAVEMKGKDAIITYWLLGEDGSPYNIRQNGYNEPSNENP